MNTEITGKIVSIGEVEVVGSTNMDKRTFVLETDGQHSQDFQIELIKDKVGLITNFKVDDHVMVAVNLRGRKWINKEGKAVYFLSLQGWRIALTNATETTELPLAEEQDDLPF